MTDVAIKVGQKWVTRGGAEVRILATDAEGHSPVVGQIVQGAAKGMVMLWKSCGEHSSGDLPLGDLISLAPATVKREVALFRSGRSVDVFEAQDERVLNDEGDDGWRRISEPVTIEFTLLPGKSAE